MKLLHIEVVFANDPSPRGEQDIKDAVQDLKEAVAYLGGKVRQADLSTLVVQPVPGAPK